METQQFAPLFERLPLSDKEKYLIEPFFTNLDTSVFGVSMLPPEVIGALCSRTSRAKDDLRVILLNEFIQPFLEEKTEYGEALRALVDFLHIHPVEQIFANPKGREFYIKWLAQFGDDSIAQMAGTHLIYAGISQVAIKHFEDMRIGIAPIEKSTRYVDYSAKINNQYRYYTDPTLEEMGLKEPYVRAMDGLFDTYTALYHHLYENIRHQYPEEKEMVVKTKAFDSIRGLLPTSTLSQVSFFGNGQTFEYLATKSLDHTLGEIRWAALRGVEELSKIIPAFLRRIDDPASQEYQRYLSERGERITTGLQEVHWKKEKQRAYRGVTLLAYDKEGENKVIATLLYPELHEPYQKVLKKVRRMQNTEKETILREVFKDRQHRYYKVPRAFEAAHMQFEIVMNIGAWRDLHRHRMLTQLREKFTVQHGFEVPPEIKEAGLHNQYSSAINRVNDLFYQIERVDPNIAQYCCALAHNVRFLQCQNLRSFFWEAELRTIAQGHPDYRKIEHEKIRLVKKVYPLLSKYLLVDMEQYDLARRGSVEQIAKKEEQLARFFHKAGKQEAEIAPDKQPPQEIT